jgi:hypothetical protein
LLGLLRDRSDVASFGDERAIVLVRCDRQLTGIGQAVPIQQEDICQAAYDLRHMAMAMSFRDSGARQPQGRGDLDVVQALVDNVAVCARQLQRRL